MFILGIETSCDETAAAIVEDGVTRVVDVVASSKELHEKTGGVVPEVAARKQVEYIVPVVAEVMSKFNSLGKDVSDVGALAVTVGPGLVGSLVVGVEAAKALALVWNKPLIPVNHLVGHMYAPFMEYSKDIVFPVIVLIVSGGHTDLVLLKAHGDFEYLGGTVDDAAGEAFDKTARILGIADYLGGAALSQKASECKDKWKGPSLPRPMIREDNYDFSFAGLKTAVKRLVEQGKYPAECVSREFQDAVVDVLVEKTLKAARNFDVKNILVGGGVASNMQLRSRLTTEAAKLNMKVFIPSLDLCTDNAVYIASAAFFNFREKSLEDIFPKPSLSVIDLP